MSDLEVISYRPRAGEYAWAFGGGALRVAEARAGLGRVDHGAAATPWPRLESDSYIMSAGSARPLEDAFRIAQHDMVTWVAQLCDLDPIDAYQFVTQAVESPLANVCDTNYTAIAKVPKRYLPKTAYSGVHAHLRSLAASL